MSGSGRCNGYGSQVMERTYRSIVPVPSDVRTGSGGVDAVASAGAFAGVRTRTGQFLGLSPLPVGPRKHAQAIRKDMPAQSTVDSTTRAKSCTHACGGRAYCNTRHDRDHGAEPPCSTEAVPTACGSADKKRGRPRSRKPFPHWADRLYRIRANPSDGGLARIIHP